MQTVAIDKFDGLLNNTCASELIADNECSRILNMQLDASMTYPRTRPGTEFVNKTNQYFNSMFMFLKSNNPNSPFLIMSSPTAGIFQSGDGGATITDITGGMDTTYPWYFKTMNDTAIGVSQGKSPIKWDGTAATVSTLNASAPLGKYIEIWNSRCWIADNTNPNRVYFSKVGDSTDWTTSGVSGAGFIEVGYNDGDIITGLVAHRERLFILKKYHIYQIITANPNTDNTLWRLELFTKEGGCISNRSIQLLNNDILFLSENGVVSLNTIQTWGDFTRSVISRKISIAVNMSETIWDSVIYIGGGRQQYWLSNTSTVYVGEQNKQGEWVWSIFSFGNGAVAGTGVAISALCQTIYNAYPVVLICNRGARYADNTYGLYRYPNSISTPALSEQILELPNAYRDDYNGPAGFRGITSYAISKFFNMNSSMSFKKFYAWAVRLVNLTYAYGTSAFNDAGGIVAVTIYGDPQVGGGGAATNVMVYREPVLLEPWGTSNLFASIKVRWSRFTKKRNATGLIFQIGIDTSQPESNWIGFGVRGLAFKTAQLNERHVWS